MAPHITCLLVQNPHWLCPPTPYLPIPWYKIIDWQPLATPSCFWVNFQPQKPRCGYKTGCKPSNLYIWDVVPTIAIHKPNSNIYFLLYNLINYNEKKMELNPLEVSNIRILTIRLFYLNFNICPLYIRCFNSNFLN